MYLRTEPQGETKESHNYSYNIQAHSISITLYFWSFCLTPEPQVEPPAGEIGGNMLQKQFFQMLPTDFTKQEAVKQAEVLGVALSTMERWITKSVQTAHIERLATGLYRKKPSCIA